MQYNKKKRSPKGFSNGEPEAASKARPKAKNPRGRRPRGFLAFGLAEDVAKGSPLGNSEGGLQYSSEGVHWVLKGPPEGSIHHDTSEAFPQIFILCT